jgi:hypothetical protein
MPSENALSERVSSSASIQADAADAAPAETRQLATTKPSSTVSADLKSYEWFVGRLRREACEQLLASCPVGTLLVRESDSGEVVSVKFADGFRHFIIERSPEGHYQLDASDAFASVPELVLWYSHPANQLANSILRSQDAHLQLYQRSSR